MDKDIQQILSEAVFAPSGDNSQPWRFEVIENKIRIINDPNVDDSLYNFQQIASYIAHGCLIENIKIISSRLGYESNISIFPEKNNTNIIADVLLQKGGDSLDSDLYPYISKRVTNRKKYFNKEIENNIISEILDLNKKFIPEVRITKNNINKLAGAAAINEKIVLENIKLHNFLYEHITWNNREDSHKKGFFIDTLEIFGIKRIFFKLFKNWKILVYFNRIIHISDIISSENSDIYNSSSAFGSLIVSVNEKEKHVELGRLLCNVWLLVTKHNLSFHPLAGLTLLNNYSKASSQNQLSDVHRALVEENYRTVRQIFELKNEEEAIMLFRIGYCDEPSAKTRRKEPVIHTQQNLI